MWDHGSVMTSTPPTRSRTRPNRGRRRETLATRHVPNGIGTLTVTLLAVATIVAWWRNNNMTEAAQDAQKVLDSLKDKE